MCVLPDCLRLWFDLLILDHQVIDNWSWLLEDSYWLSNKEFHSNVNILGVLQTFVKNKLINSCFHIGNIQTWKCDLHFPRAGPYSFFMRISLKSLLSTSLNILHIWGPCVLISGGKTSAAWWQGHGSAPSGSLEEPCFCAEVGVNSGAQSTRVSQQFWSVTQEAVIGGKAPRLICWWKEIYNSTFTFSKYFMIANECSSKWVWEECQHLCPHCTRGNWDTFSGSLTVAGKFTVEEGLVKL